jgi:membrane protein
MQQHTPGVGAVAHGRRWRLLQYYVSSQDLKEVAQRFRHEIGRDNLGLVAAGIAFYAMLALFPALAAAVSLYGLAADPVTLADQINRLSALVPSQAWALIEEQLSKIVSASSASLGVGAVAGIAFAVWSASKALTALITSLNIVYGVAETRGFFHVIALALAMTAGAIVFLVIALLLVVALPAIFGAIGQADTTRAVLGWLRWPLIAGTLLAALATLFKFAPNLPNASWRWITPGGAVATITFLLVSVAFSRYVASFGNYNEVYGSVGAVVALLMWLYFTAYAILLGAELNAELDRQTGRGVPKAGPVLSDKPEPDVGLAMPPSKLRSHGMVIGHALLRSTRAVAGVAVTLALTRLRHAAARPKRGR